MAVTKLLKFKNVIDLKIKKQIGKRMEFPKIRTIFQKFPNIQFKDPKAKAKRTNWLSDKKSKPSKKKKKVTTSGWGKPIGLAKIKKAASAKQKTTTTNKRKQAPKKNLHSRFSLNQTPEINDAEFPKADKKPLSITKSKSSQLKRKKILETIPKKIISKKEEEKVIKVEEEKKEVKVVKK